MVWTTRFRFSTFQYESCKSSRGDMAECETWLVTPCIASLKCSFTYGSSDFIFALRERLGSVW